MDYWPALAPATSGRPGRLGSPAWSAGRSWDRSRCRGRIVINGALRRLSTAPLNSDGTSGHDSASVESEWWGEVDVIEP